MLFGDGAGDVEGGGVMFVPVKCWGLVLVSMFSCGVWCSWCCC